MTTRRTTKKTQWNVRKLITRLGGDTHLSRMLDAYGYRAATRKTIQGWKVRNSIPGSRIPDLLSLASDMHVNLHITDFVIVTEGE